MSLLSLASILIIQNSGNYPVDEERLGTIYERALSHFESELGPLSEPITVSISTDDCLRTGYNRKTREVVFCPTQNVIDAGLQSVDVINHELFHAFLCQANKNLCQTDEYDFLHEALADKFSFELNPDKYFGENFYQAHDYIRSFASTWRVGLVKTEHEQGNALAARFISENKSLRELMKLFSETKPPSEVETRVEGRAVSRLNRYRLKMDEILRLSFHFSPQVDVTRMKWLVPRGVEIKDFNKFQFEIQVDPKLKQSKSLVIFISGDGQEIGREAFYFGTEI